MSVENDNPEIPFELIDKETLLYLDDKILKAALEDRFTELEQQIVDEFADLFDKLDEIGDESHFFDYVLSGAVAFLLMVWVFQLDLSPGSAMTYGGLLGYILGSMTGQSMHEEMRAAVISNLVQTNGGDDLLQLKTEIWNSLPDEAKTDLTTAYNELFEDDDELDEAASDLDQDETETQS